jgi:hypothetical protein
MLVSGAGILLKSPERGFECSLVWLLLRIAPGFLFGIATHIQSLGTKWWLSHNL